MARTLNQILQEADSIIEKRASVVPPPAEPVEDEIFKLAEQVRNHKSVVSLPEPFEFTHAEKVAQAMAILETILSAKELLAMSKFEKEALARGMDEQGVNKFFAKVAATSPAGRRVFEHMSKMANSINEYVSRRVG